MPTKLVSRGIDSLVHLEVLGKSHNIGWLFLIRRLLHLLKVILHVLIFLVDLLPIGVRWLDTWILIENISFQVRAEQRLQ